MAETTSSETIDSTTSAKPYHHGDLPAALRAATAQLVSEKGASGFSLREVARRAGVSHAAPAHHFGDARGLLTSLAAEGFEQLSDALDATVDAGPRDAASRLNRCGKAYVRTALRYPGHFAVIFQRDLIDQSDEACLTASLTAYGHLQNTIEVVRDELNPELDVSTAATLCWAGMQGLVTLAPKLDNVSEETNTKYHSLDDLVEAFTDMFLNGVRAR